MKSLILLVPLLTVVAAKTSCECDFTSRAVICKGLTLTEFHKKDSGCENAFWKIDVSENSLQVFPDDLQHFRNVNLSLNLLERLEASTEQKVIYLDVSRNNILQIDLENKFQSLQLLIANNNHLGILDDFLDGQCNIVHLDVSGNKIKRLKTVTKCAHLSILQASSNKISQVTKDLVHLTKLQVLDLSKNNIKDVSGLPSTLETLDLSHNSIERIRDSSFKGLASLQALDLKTNRISSIEKLSFATLTSLTSLSLRVNKLKVLSSDFFKGLVSLRFINLGLNSIESLSNDTFSDLSALETVTLESNKINTLPALQFGRKVIRIILARNSITRMDHSALLTMFSGTGDKRYIAIFINNLRGDDPEWSNVLKYFNGECSPTVKSKTQNFLNEYGYVNSFEKYVLDPSPCACATFTKDNRRLDVCIADGAEVGGLPWLEAAQENAEMKDEDARHSKTKREEF